MHTSLYRTEGASFLCNIHHDRVTLLLSPVDEDGDGEGHDEDEEDHDGNHLVDGDGF